MSLQVLQFVTIDTSQKDPFHPKPKQSGPSGKLALRDTVTVLTDDIIPRWCP